ncbi:MAG: adenylyltransferase/cytidyltransferase family protein [Clostridia bacterium]|nr:adenylyltransferase/cytidyltransferase family protein [Clostridia bacterium]
MQEIRLISGGSSGKREVPIEITLFPAPLRGRLSEDYKEFLFSCGLRDEGDADVTALMTDDDDTIVACGSRSGHILKQFAVSPALEGSGVFASVLSALQSDAVQSGVPRLFLCTKPQNLRMVSSMGFYPVVSTQESVLTENRRNGFQDFLASLPRFSGTCGAIVMNADPFTLGHLHLAEYASARCDTLYLFAVSEAGSLFSPEERYEMIERGTAHLHNRVVCRSDMYLVSRATFPAYFIRDEAHAEEVRSDLDIELFRARIAPALGIVKRFVGEEPFSPVTRAYNERMKKLLPESGIELIEIPRLRNISAGSVRALLREGEMEKAAEAVPKTTYETILRHFGTDA